MKLVLSPEWRAWLAENRLQGVPREKLLDLVTTQGVPRREAERYLVEVEKSPAFLGAQRVSRRARQLSLITKLHLAVAESSAPEGGVRRAPGASPEEFLERYYATNTPVVLTELLRDWPATHRWTPEYFRERFGAAEVEIAEGRDSDPHYDMNFRAHLRSTTMADYVDRVLAGGPSNDLYMIANNRNTARPELLPLFEDVRLPSYLDPERAPGSSALWLGPAGTVTPLHHDTSSILFCQFHGRKRIRLISPFEAALFDHATGVYAAVDPEAPDLERFPWFPDVQMSQVDLAPGEALFIPVGYWHHVRALDVSRSLALSNFRAPNRYEWYKPGGV